MNPKIERITAEIEKLRVKQISIQTRLRDLERQKTELENADIVAAVRGVDIAPDDFAAFVRMFKEKLGEVVPDISHIRETAEDTTISRHSTDKIQSDKEDERIEN